jgi:hypothetical protein
VKPVKPPPPDYTGERARKEDHGLAMLNARIKYATARICPDCYRPRIHCTCPPGA